MALEIEIFKKISFCVKSRSKINLLSYLRKVTSNGQKTKTGVPFKLFQVENFDTVNVLSWIQIQFMHELLMVANAYKD